MLTNDSSVGRIMSQFSIHWCNILTQIFKSTKRVCGLDLFCIWHLNSATVSLGGSKHGTEGNLHFIGSLSGKGYSVMIGHLGKAVP